MVNVDYYKNLATEQMHGVFVVKDKDGRFVYMNDLSVKLIGYQSIDDVVGLTDYDVACPAVEFADVFVKQDQQVFEGNTLEHLEMQVYADGKIHVMLSKKRPLKDLNGNIIGLVGSAAFLDNSILNNFIISIYQEKEKFHGKQVALSCLLQIEYQEFGLSARQSECLFLMLHGKKNADIAYLLDISIRTVETHFLNIREKLGVFSKKQLLDFCVDKNLHSQIPKRLLNKPFSLLLAQD